MSATITTPEPSPLVLHFGSFVQNMSDEQFYLFCRENPDLRIERTAEGDLVIMPPTGGKTGQRNAELTRQFANWAAEEGTGIVFDSSTEFRLPNGAMRSPEVSWVHRSRWNALSEKEQEQFPPLCPDFVLELRSPTDSIRMLKKKMEEYIEQGAGLAWLLDPRDRRVYIYRPNAEVEVLDNPEMVTGEPTLPGFALSLSDIW